MDFGFKNLSIGDVRDYFDAGEIGKCFKVYADGSMERVNPGTSWEEIGRFANNGGEFAYKLPTREIAFKNGCKAIAPEIIDISVEGSLDKEREMLQETIRAYFGRFGIISKDVDKGLALHMENALVDKLEAAGVSFLKGAYNGTDREVYVVVSTGRKAKNVGPVMAVMGDDLERFFATAEKAKADYHRGKMGFDTDFITVLGEYLKRDGVNYRFELYSVC